MDEIFVVSITPQWPELPKNTVLEVFAYTTTGFTFSAEISGPGLPNGINTGNIPGDKPFLSTDNVIPNYRQGETLNYNLKITCNTGFDTDISEQQELGLKPVDLPISYQRTVFCNDSGDDNDWNDLVVVFTLYNQSGD